MKKVLCVFLLLFGMSNISIPQVAIVVNKSTVVKDIDASVLLDIFSMNIRKWNNDAPIIVFGLKGNSEIDSAFYAYLGKKPLDMKKLWMRLQLSGEGKAPTMFTSEDDLVKKIAATPGAIGFISLDHVTDNVKVIVTIK